MLAVFFCSRLGPMKPDIAAAIAAFVASISLLETLGDDPSVTTLLPLLAIAVEPAKKTVVGLDLAGQHRLMARPEAAGADDQLRPEPFGCRRESGKRAVDVHAVSAAPACNSGVVLDQCGCAVGPGDRHQELSDSLQDSGPAGLVGNEQ